MNYLVAYTLRKNTSPFTYLNKWFVFKDEENLKFEDAQRFYSSLKENDGDGMEEGYNLLNAYICTVDKFVDFIHNWNDGITHETYTQVFEYSKNGTESYKKSKGVETPHASI